MQRVAQYSKKESRQHVVDSIQGKTKTKKFLSTVYRLLSTCKGFSMIEMIIALFILTVAVLGLLDLTITSIKTNMQNDIRNTAVRLTSQTAEVLLMRPFDTTCGSGIQCSTAPAAPTCGITLDSSITTGAWASVALFNAAYTYDNLNTCLIDSVAATDYQKYPYPQQRITGSATVTGQTYNITWTVTVPTDTGGQPVANLLQISILVSYNYRGQVYTNNAVIYKPK